jgi:hypothetical protein
MRRQQGRDLLALMKSEKILLFGWAILCLWLLAYVAGTAGYSGGPPKSLYQDDEHLALIYAPADLKNESIKKGDIVAVSIIKKNGEYVIGHHGGESATYYFWGYTGPFRYLERYRPDPNGYRWSSSSNIILAGQESILLNYEDGGSRCTDYLIEIYSVKDNQYVSQYSFWLSGDSDLFPHAYLSRGRYIVFFQPMDFTVAGGFGQVFPLNRISGRFEKGNFLINGLAVFYCDGRAFLLALLLLVCAFILALAYGVSASVSYWVRKKRRHHV